MTEVSNEHGKILKVGIIGLGEIAQVRLIGDTIYLNPLPQEQNDINRLLI